VQRLKTLLGNEQSLRSLFKKTQTLAALQEHFVHAAPPYIGESSQVSGLIFGTLSVCVANNTVAAKLRHLAPEIVYALQDRGCEVNEIRVKVQVAYAAVKPKRTPRALTSKARNALSELSESLPDSPLKNAVEKMMRKKT